MSLIEIKCPMCKGVLWIDSSTGRLVDHKSADHKKIDFNDFIKSQKNRGTELENKFLKSKEEKEKRKKQLENDFKKARQDPDSLKDDYQSPFQWD